MFASLFSFFFGNPNAGKIPARGPQRGARMYDKPRTVSSYNREIWR